MIWQMISVRRFHVRAMETLDELLTNPTVDAVYIAVPHYLLAPLTQRLLEAGKHALTEKPLAISLEEVDQTDQSGDRTTISTGSFL